MALQQKSPNAFRTISEVAEELDVQQHVLRFWETKFSSIKPLKRGGGRRYYRPGDVALIKKIHTLLYTEGYTIKRVQKLLKGVSKSTVLQGQRNPQQSQQPHVHGDNVPSIAGVGVDVEPSVMITKFALSETQKQSLSDILNDLLEMRDMINNDSDNAQNVA